MPDIDDLFETDANDSDLVKTLRGALKAMTKEKNETAARLADIEKGARSRTLADVFKDKGLDPKAAGLYPKDADASAEAVETWLGEYGELFGLEKSESAASGDTQNAASRLAQVTASAPNSTQSYDVDALAAEMAAAKNPAELAAAMSKAGLDSFA